VIGEKSSGSWPRHRSKKYVTVSLQTLILRIINFA
jgi:hypothetical protein